MEVQTALIDALDKARIARAHLSRGWRDELSPLVLDAAKAGEPLVTLREFKAGKREYTKAEEYDYSSTDEVQLAKLAEAGYIAPKALFERRQALAADAERLDMLEPAQVQLSQVRTEVFNASANVLRLELSLADAKRQLEQSTAKLAQLEGELALLLG